jgi:hypothetical protein
LNEKNLGEYFDMLEELHVKRCFKPENIHGTDESGV